MGYLILIGLRGIARNRKLYDTYWFSDKAGDGQSATFGCMVGRGTLLRPLVGLQDASQGEHGLIYIVPDFSVVICELL